MNVRTLHQEKSRKRKSPAFSPFPLKFNQYLEICDKSREATHCININIDRQYDSKL